MEDEWTAVLVGNRLVKFTYLELDPGAAFLTAQIAGHHVVYSVLWQEAPVPYSREVVERQFSAECPLLPT